MPPFGRPNVEKLEASGNVRALIKALGYAPDPQVRIEAARDHAWGDDQSVANAAAGALGQFTLREI